MSWSSKGKYFHIMKKLVQKTLAVNPYEFLSSLGSLLDYFYGDRYMQMFYPDTFHIS